MVKLAGAYDKLASSLTKFGGFTINWWW
jgi:hypothetical protein